MVANLEVGSQLGLQVIPQTLQYICGGTICAKLDVSSNVVVQASVHALQMIGGRTVSGS